MDQHEIDKLASLELLQKAVSCDSLAIAEILIQSAYRLDNTVPVEEYRRVCLNNWLVRQARDRIK